MSLLDWDESAAKDFSECVLNLNKNVKRCKICNNYCEGDDICSICNDSGRENIICVVEDAKSLITIEKVRDYNGKYHVLGGALSPVNGIGPDQLKIKELINRVRNETVDELIIATNPTIEGEATAVFLTNILKPYNIKITRLAYGVPVGSDIEYADEMTLFRAIDGRREV